MTPPPQAKNGMREHALRGRESDISKKASFMSSGSIVQERSGTFLDGVFYELGVQYDDMILDEDCKDDWFRNDRDCSDCWLSLALSPSFTVVPSGGKSHTVSDEKPVTHCPLHGEHITQRHTFGIDVSCYGGEFDEFIPVGYGNGEVATKAFTERVHQLGLKGLKQLDFFVDNDRVVRQPPEPVELSLWQFHGVIFPQPRLVTGAENCCPFCGQAPLVCPGCGRVMETCDRCGERTCYKTVHAHEQPESTVKLHFEFDWDEPRIFSGPTWDGSDFMQSGGASLITWRVADWLFRIDAKPFYAKPVLVRTDGMTDEQHRWLERVQQPLTETM